MSAAEVANVAPHDRVFGRLRWLTTAAMLPWLVLSCFSIMACVSPNAIITPLIWVLMVSIWSYPVVLMAGRFSARALRLYGQYDRANLLMSLPSALAAFLFAMLIVPLAIVPMFTDGYLGLMASCLLSIVVASWTLGWLKR